MSLAGVELCWVVLGWLYCSTRIPRTMSRAISQWREVGLACMVKPAAVRSQGSRAPRSSCVRATERFGPESARKKENKRHRCNPTKKRPKKRKQTPPMQSDKKRDQKQKTNAIGQINAAESKIHPLNLVFAVFNYFVRFVSRSCSRLV